MSGPITVRALTITERKSFKLSILEFPEPALAHDEFLIENVAVAQNPVDWKQIANDSIPQVPWTNGGDVAGTIVRIGKNVKGFALGDRVISFLSRKTARHSAYQTHSISSSERTVRLPQGYTFESGSTIPLAYTTAGAGLIATLGVQIPATTVQAPATGVPLLVWGGSSSVGAYVIQLAKLAGYRVLATASPANHEYVRSLGASQVFDYHSEDVVAQIRAAAGPNLSLVYDAISTPASLRPSAESITAPKGLVASIGSVPASPVAHVQIVSTGARLAFEQPAVGVRVYAVLQALLDQGRFIPNPVKIVPGGLRGVESGLLLAKNGGVSAQKLVYRIADTDF